MQVPKKKALLVFVAVAVFAASLITVAVAAYTMTAPTSDPSTTNPTPSPSPTPSPTPVPQATMSKVTVTPSVAYIGETKQVTTTVSDLTPGITVTFYNNDDVAVGAAITNAQGTATITIQEPIGTWTYYATAVHP